MTRCFVLVLVLTLLTWGVHSVSLFQKENLMLTDILAESVILDNQRTNKLPEDEATHEGSGGDIVGTTGNGTGMFDDDNEGHEDPDGDIYGDNYGDTGLDTVGSGEDSDEVAGNSDGYNEGDIKAQANDGDTEDKEGVSEDSSEDIEDMKMKNTVRGTGVHGATFQIRSQSNVSSTCEVPVDLFWLLDGSNSVGTANFEKVKQFVVDVVNSFDVSPTATRVGVVQYSNKNTLMFNLGDKVDKPSTVNAINSIQYQGGGTYTGYALKYVRQKAAWRGGNVPKVAVVLTDGESYDSVSVAAQNLLSDGVEVFAVGVAGFKLIAIANSNETNVIELNDFNDLTTKIGEIAKKVCSHASEGPRDHAFEVLRTANQKYQGVDFFVIEARLPVDGVSGFESWCRDYQRLCEQYGLRPTGCGEKYTTWNSGGSRSTCPTEYNSDMYINNVLGCYPNDGVKEVANMAFSAGATATNSFGFSYCAKKYCQRKIDKCRYSLYENTVSSYPNGDRIVYTVCKGSADTDDCAANPCVNGDCVDGENSYTCTCHSGYEGINCDKDINGCSPNPCHTEATCEDIPAPGTGAKCTCKPGFVGDGTSGGSGCKPKDINGCSPNPCHTEATCEDIPAPGTDIDDCAANPCVNGDCVDGVNSYTCTCFPGYEGTNCDKDLYRCGTQLVCTNKDSVTRTVAPQLTAPTTFSVQTCTAVELRCKYERQEWVHSTFLPIPGGLNFTEEGFGQLEVRLSMFPTGQYQNPYRGSQYPIHLRMRQHIYMQLEVQGHGQKLSVLALNCKATMSPRPDDTPQYQLIKDGCASDSTLHYYNINDRSKERFGFEAFRFIKDLKTVYVHCEVMVCDGADSRSRCAQGCVKRGKRATGEKTDMKGRHMIYQGPIILDDDKEETVRLMSDQETASGRHSAPWAMLAAGGGLMALALVVMGAAIVLKRSRREEWAYQSLPNMAENGE
uniref:Uncharacterized protein n=1 Tax=Branchiostoma floridae TaxID=7739 RepID=C3XUV1_BRAFL|eukprot:XP_002612167.1 hypothetical protein BRAFLDRAFT_88906 [Branchiostoma floridae]